MVELLEKLLKDNISLNQNNVVQEKKYSERLKQPWQVLTTAKRRHRLLKS